MKTKNKLNRSRYIIIRWPFRLLLLFGLSILLYKGYLDLFVNANNRSIYLYFIELCIQLIIAGIIIRPILKGEIGTYFFFYNFKNNRVFKYLSKYSKNSERQKKIFLKNTRVKFDNFLVSKKMVQIWGLLDLIAIILFWEYFYDNLEFIYQTILGNKVVHHSMLPYYLTAILSVTLLFSGVLLITDKKIGGKIVIFQFMFKLFAYLPSIFPILWLFGFTIEHRNIKALVFTTICVELIRMHSIIYYFKFSKNRINNFE